MLFRDGVASDDLYSLLRVAAQATADEIHSAWLSQMQQWHPDRNRDPMATVRTQAINQAHQILRDVSLRALYDRHGLAGSESPSSSKRSTAEEAAWRATRRQWAAEEAQWQATQAEQQARDRRFQEYLEVTVRMDAAYAADDKGHRRLREALVAALSAVALIPQNVRDTVSEIASFQREGWFPAPWECVTLGFLLATALQDESCLEQIAVVLNSDSVLVPWRSLIEPARRSFGDASAILRYVGDHPGTIQARLGRELGQDQRSVTSHLCYWLNAAGSLRRERAGNSYALFLP